MNRAIFLDKDGTLIDDIPYNVNPALITLKTGVLTGLGRLQQAGFRFIMVTNQSGIARGYFAEADLPPVFERISALLAPQGIRIRGYYYCPNHPQGTVAPYAISCNFRKPMPGMLLQAAAEHGIDLSQSWMIGDILHDVEAGKRAGCRSILIDNGGETEWIKDNPYREPDFVAADLNEAASCIIHTLTPNPQPV